MKTPDEIARGGGRIGTANGRHRVMSLGPFAAIVTLVACMHAASRGLKKRDATAASVEGRLPSVFYNRFCAAATMLDIRSRQLGLHHRTCAAPVAARRTDFGSSQQSWSIGNMRAASLPSSPTSN
jgi:hypothetical protein